MRRFYLFRKHDVSGVSGEGIVAVGVLLPSGRVVLEWLGALSSLVVHDGISSVEAIHGHHGNTEIKWIDDGILP